MAYFGFTNKLLAGKSIQFYNYGNCCRDFIYVDDIVERVVRVITGNSVRRRVKMASPFHLCGLRTTSSGSRRTCRTLFKTLQEEIVRAGVLPRDSVFEAHKELVPM